MPTTTTKADGHPAESAHTAAPLTAIPLETLEQVTGGNEHLYEDGIHYIGVNNHGYVPIGTY